MWNLIDKEGLIMYQKANTPEEVGVNSRVVLEMLDTVEKGGVYNHSTIILRNGKIAFEKYNAPYSPEYAHDMFSVSKGDHTPVEPFFSGTSGISLSSRLSP